MTDDGWRDIASAPKRKNNVLIITLDPHDRRIRERKQALEAVGYSVTVKKPRTNGMRGFEYNFVVLDETISMESPIKEDPSHGH